MACRCGAITTRPTRAGILSWTATAWSRRRLSLPPHVRSKPTLGPGSSGSPLLVYKACPNSCHLVVSGADGSDPRAVPGSDAAREPTIWGDRVAWVRGANQVMTSLLDGSGRRMLSGAPRRLCPPANKEMRTSCETTTNRSVTGLQLYYGRLALTDSFYTRNGGATGSPGRSDHTSSRRLHVRRNSIQLAPSARPVRARSRRLHRPGHVIGQQPTGVRSSQSCSCSTGA